MTQVSDDSPVTSPYSEEAGNFIQMMSDLDSRFNLDYTYESILRLEGFISDTFDQTGVPHTGEQMPLGVGAYVGETIIRTLGGQWDPNGKPEIIGLSESVSTNPIEKAKLRFTRGPKESLSWYYQTLRRQHFLNPEPYNHKKGKVPSPRQKADASGNMLSRVFGFLLGRG